MTAREIIHAWSMECLRGPIRYVLEEMQRAGINDPELQLSNHFKDMAQILDERAGDAPTRD